MLSLHDEDALTFCDQCGYLQPGVQAACGQCGVPLDRSVYDPFVTISQNAAVVRQAVRGRVKPSTFGRFALLALGLLYLAQAGLALDWLARVGFSPLSAVVLLVDLAVGLTILYGYRALRARDTWAEYRRWS